MVQSGLVGWWPLTGNTPVDVSGNDTDGTIEGSPKTGVSGIGGLTSWNFNSNNPDYITLADTPELTMGTGSISISLWIRPTGTGRIFDTGARSDEGYSVFINGSESLILQLNNPNLNRESVATQNLDIDGKWHHIVGVWGREGEYTLYLDGKIVDRRGFPGNYEGVFVDNFGTPRIASEGTTISQTFDGDIQDVRVYNRPITPSEVPILYQKGAADLSTPPSASDASAVARYSFDDRSDTSTAVDEWGSNDGTINGASYSIDSPRDAELSMFFDAVNNEDIQTPNFGFDSTTPFTISVWTKVRDTSGGKGIFGRLDSSNEDTIFLTFNSDEEISFEVGHNNGNKLSTGNIAGDFVDVWQHFVAIFDPSTPEVRLYNNGVQIGRGTGTFDEFADTTNTYIGSRSGGGDQEYDGNIDDVRIYDRVLDDSEIYQLYRWGSPGVDLRSETVTR